MQLCCVDARKRNRTGDLEKERRYKSALLQSPVFCVQGGTNMKMKMKLTDNQTAFEYAVYMIVGSYFQSAGCKSVLQEQRMRIQYWEQKLDTQYRMEDCCIRYVERQLLEQVPKDCWEQKVKVTFCTDSETGESEIRFEGDRYVLSIFGQWDRRRSELSHLCFKRAF